MVFYVFYIISEVPSNLILKRVGSQWLAVVSFFSRLVRALRVLIFLPDLALLLLRSRHYRLRLDQELRRVPRGANLARNLRRRRYALFPVFLSDLDLVLTLLPHN